MKKEAFTLAEVLITLGIIGVVAALTLPSLIQNYQKQVWVNQLKKNVSVLENGFKKAMADDGVDKLTDTTLWQSAAEINNYLSLSTEAKRNNFFNSLKKYFNIISVSNESRPIGALNNVNLVNFGVSYPMSFADGSQIGFNRVNITAQADIFGNPHGAVAAVAVDVNGYKKPNQLGRDVFAFGVTERGEVIPVGGNGAVYAYAKYFYCPRNPNMSFPPNSGGCVNYSSQLTKSNTISMFYETNCTLNGDGKSCAARIMENGWKMDY